MAKKLITLEQSNLLHKDVHITDNMVLPKKNSIKCPICGKELYDSYPNVTLTSDPPQKNTHCKKCGYVGYRVC
jgi:hypothetical protein